MLIRLRGGDQGISPVMAVGFADMVGFTMLSQHLSDRELAAVVSRFEELAHDIVTSMGGRVVKMIGDEAMFVVSSAADAARIGLALAEAYADDDLLSDVRVALAIGPVLVQDGDFYGPVVNLASRLVGDRQPGHRADVRRDPRRPGRRGRRRNRAPPAAAPGRSRTSGGCRCGGFRAGGPTGRRPPAHRPVGAAGRRARGSSTSCASGGESGDARQGRAAPSRRSGGDAVGAERERPSKGDRAAP